ncbi:MAG: TrmH family RNA methyltransferase [Pseudomonadales bacterium]
MLEQTQDYQQKKAFFAKVITVYGRKPALEVLRDESLQIYRLHFASSNKSSADLVEIEALAQRRGIDIKTHKRAELARISRNSRQDQGVAVDVMCHALTQFNEWHNAWAQQEQRPRVVLIALDGVTNSQNLGMIIRSCCAAGVDGILLPTKGAAGLNPLTIKASAGSVFKAPIIVCPSLPLALQHLSEHRLPIFALKANAERNLFATQLGGSAVFVLGNESLGVSPEIAGYCTDSLAIPMYNGVESLNVAVAAALIAYHAHSQR